MALENGSGNYFKIKTVTGVNSDTKKLVLEIEEYENKTIRDLPGKYDKYLLDKRTVELSEEDTNSFITKIYTELKKQDPYSEMIDA